MHMDGQVFGHGNCVLFEIPTGWWVFKSEVGIANVDRLGRSLFFTWSPGNCGWNMWTCMCTVVGTQKDMCRI
ncbi:hypothetical protein VTJ04DRAFT_7583 [Mycothermus thermophilus]|uniref:uncharacterized protein n=1 Tax=Humicola insolens TaxID=85995 RepID=UPI0037447485